MRRLMMLSALLAGCYSLPAWKGDVTVKPVERESVKTCGTGELTAQGKQRITRAPFLQSTTTRTVTVAWGARDEIGEVLLREPNGDVVAITPAQYAGDKDRKQRRLAAQRSPKPIKPDDVYLLRADLGALKPTHLYCYQVLANGVPMTEPAPLLTATAPNADKPTKFVAIGDTGTGGAAQKAMAKRMSELEFEFMLFLGDIAYTSGTPSQIDHRFFDVYRDILRYVPAFPAIGNHERRTQQGRPYFDSFVLPGAERYYSFDWGDVHFVAIDTTQYESAQLKWLDDDLRRNKLPWVIVFGHHPPYTSSFRGPQKAVRKAFAKILTHHRVDFVVTGHEHQYERFRIADVNYVVSGGGGGRLSYFRDNQGALVQATKHHFLAFEATAKKLTMKVIDIDGKQLDTVALDHVPRVREQSPIAPETKIKSDPTIHDKPDGDESKPKLPEQKPVVPETPKEKEQKKTDPAQTAPLTSQR
jgi:predicted phosphodiesterase